MSAEITVIAGLQCRNGDFQLLINAAQLQADQAVAGGGNPGTIVVETSAAAIPFTGLTSPGWIWMRNLDDTNFVEVGPDDDGTFVPCITLLPGEVALFRFAGGTLKARADTAPCRLHVQALET